MATDIENYVSCSLALNSKVLDLSGKELRTIPFSYDFLRNIEYLYLEGNSLLEVPEQLFLHCHALRYLDLRNNKLVYLPPTIGRLKALRTLLLSGNKLKKLPVEIGHLKRLSSLNLCDKNLEFPPNHVIKQGTRAVISYLKDRLGEAGQDRSSSEDERLELSRKCITLQSLSPNPNIVAKNVSGDGNKVTQMKNASDVQSLLPLPLPQQAPVHSIQPETVTERRINYSSKVPHPVTVKHKSANTTHGNKPKKRRSKGSAHTDTTPTQEFGGKIEEDMLQKAKIDAAIEKQKSKEYLSSWRQETRAIQTQKHRDVGRGNKFMYTRAAELAPFSTDLQTAHKQPTSVARDQMNAMDYQRDSVREFSKQDLPRTSFLREQVVSVKAPEWACDHSDSEDDWSHDPIDPSKRAHEYRLRAFLPGSSHMSTRRKKV